MSWESDGSEGDDKRRERYSEVGLGISLPFLDKRVITTVRWGNRNTYSGIMLHLYTTSRTDPHIFFALHSFQADFAMDGCRADLVLLSRQYTAEQQSRQIVAYKVVA